jgi:hypothetical protein
MSDAGLSESERALARSYYDERRWPLARTLAWIASPTIETLAHYEAVFLGRTLARITKQQFAAGARGRQAVLRALGYPGAAVGAEGPASHNPDEVDELLGALKADKLRAIGPDNNPMPPEFWDDQSSVDPRTWPNVRFRREDVRRLWPAVDAVAAEGGSRAAAPLEAEAGEEVAELAATQQHDPSAANVRSTSPAELGRAGGKRSGAVRRGKMIWPIHANEIAQAAYLANAAQSDESIASEIGAGWKLDKVDCPEHKTLTVFVSELRTSGLLPPRSASLPKRSG